MASGSSPVYADGSANTPKLKRRQRLGGRGAVGIEFLLRMQLADGVRRRLPVGAFAADDRLAFTEIDAGAWAAGIDRAWPTPPPGAVSGGPNNVNMSDPVADAMSGCAPQTCWRDDARSFTQNEVAINWNAPLVWAVTFLE